MKVCFRTTSSNAVGFGHLRRCLTLAEALKEKGIASLFGLSGEVRGLDIASDAGFVAELSHAIDSRDVVPLIADFAHGAQVLVLDDYALSDTRGREIDAALGATKIMVIDDLADRTLAFADVVLNPSAGLPIDVYSEARHGNTRLAVGPRFALLRKEFRHQAPRVCRQHVERVLLTLGGADPSGLTALVAHDLLETLPDVRIDAVCGPLFSFSAIRALTDLSRLHPRLHVHSTGTRIADLMRAADIAVAAGGQTVFELAAVGLPSVALMIAGNQHRNLTEMQRAKTLVHSDRDNLCDAVARLAGSHADRQAMALAGQALVDGFGAARTAELIAEVGKA